MTAFDNISDNYFKKKQILIFYEEIKKIQYVTD